MPLASSPRRASAPRPLASGDKRDAILRAAIQVFARRGFFHAQVAELEPGDALFIPSLWYHHVEGLAQFNILMNYWWRDSPRYLGQPNNALHHAIMTIRDLPDHERAVWRAMFDHYVFSGGADARDHVPAQGQGVLAPLDAQSAARMHQFLLRSLSQ